MDVKEQLKNIVSEWRRFKEDAKMSEEQPKVEEIIDREFKRAFQLWKVRDP